MTETVPKPTSMSGLIEIIVVVLGAYFGTMINNALMSAKELNIEITTYNNTKLTVGGIAGLGISLALLIFGNKIHKLVQWFAVGWFATTSAQWLSAIITPYKGA